MTFLDDPEETIIATIVVPTEIEEPEEIEEETELVGEEVPEGEEAPRARRARASAEPRGGRGVLSLFRRGAGGRRRRQGRLARRRARQPRRPLRPYPPQRGLRGGGALAADRWGLSTAKKKYGGLYTDGRAGPGGPRVAVLLPQTYMNESGGSVSPARGALGVPLDRVVAIHDEIDLPFGRIETRLDGGSPDTTA